MQPLRRRARRTRAEMNVVPYIDVMLVLLIIFMAVSPMIQTKVLNLPKMPQVRGIKMQHFKNTTLAKSSW